MPQPPHLDYSDRDLRNRSFKDQDLIGANFSGADLTKANFQGAYTAQSQTQIIVRRAIVAISAVFAPLSIIGALGYAPAFGYATSLAFVIIFALTGVLFVRANQPLAKSIAAGVILIGSAFATTLALAVAVATKAVSVFNEINFQQIFSSSYSRDLFSIGMGYLLFSLAILGFGVYGFLELLKILKILPGTRFENADLSEANFTNAVLQNADFSGCLLNHVNWTGAKFYRCKFPKHFQDSTIRALCTSRNGYKHDYRGANLKNLHLAAADLTRANLSGADLSGADLQYADLREASLQGAQALGTNFSNAVLTGACIQHWGINAATRFDDVRCDYIYLEPNQQERRPASGIFQAGDFAKLVSQFSQTLDFLFRNGIEAQAFDVALKNLLTEYKDEGLSLHSLVDVGDGDRLVKLNVANLTADKAPMHAQFTQDYQAMQQLAAPPREKDQALQQDLDHTKGQLTAYREQLAFLRDLFHYQTDRFSRASINASNSQIIYAPDSQFTGDTMSDKRSNIELTNVTGDISGIAGGDISGVVGKDITGSAGGDISGTLTLTLGQLEATQDPEALKLADLLKQLKAAIETPDAGLDAKDKEKALKHLDAIAKLGGDRKNPDLLERADGALDALETIVKRGNGLLEFSENYLPTITAGIKTVLAAWGIAL
ncbi:MAG: pentapeptide repeat-containing protein [Lyngbya sp. HA4199-MV5]|jgi:uncharacterized protein YjbI with pentapeptide repeats|nr:pentapeptide repeat-containing protein [Lyngbya sp. HA4199-MV5]